MIFSSNSLLSASSYIIELLPFHILAYYPFRGKFRFPIWTIFFLVGFNMSCEFLVCCHQYNIGQDIRTWDIVFAISSMAIYLTCVKTEIPKLLFIYTLVVDYIMIVRGIAIFLDIQFFRGPGISYRFLGTPVDTIIRLIPLVVTAPFMLIFLDITKERVLRSYASKLWRVIWLVPALTTLVVLTFTWNINTMSVPGLLFLLARVCLLIMVFIMYYILVSSLESLKLQGEAEERARNQEQLIALQRSQYIRLQKQIEETRQARHDLRQHLNVIQTYLNKGDKNLLEDYIEKYGQKLCSLTPKTYCNNFAVDAVVRYYAEKAEENNIKFKSCINLPIELSIDEPDICIVFGNLLENAVDSCILISQGTPFIRIHARVAGEKAISITIDNSCVQEPIIKAGCLMSSKHSGPGTGTMSVCNIALQYHGIADFKYQAGIFYSSVFLNP